MKWFSLLVLCCAPVFGGEWLLPWVSNLDGAWKSTLIVNNHAAETVRFDLTAMRPDGTTQSISAIEVGPLGQWTGDAGSVFAELGSGGGYSVFVRSDSDQLSTAVAVASLNTASGDSPALTAGINTRMLGNRLVFPVMQDPDTGFAAPVIVNLDTTDAAVSLRAMGPNGQIGETMALTVPAGRPIAELTSSLWPNLDETTYLLAESTTRIGGAAFAFNAIREPSMTLAQPAGTPNTDDLDTMLASLGAMSSVLQVYAEGGDGESGKMDCPEIAINNDLQSGSLQIEADWGAGCTNSLGVTHAGSISFLFQFVSAGSFPTWLSGDLTLSQFQTSYQGQSSTFDGQVHAEADINSLNLSASGLLTAQVSGVESWYGSYASRFSLSAHHVGDARYNLYGDFFIEVTDTEYASMQALVSSSDPLRYDFSLCPWPVSGKVDIRIFYGYPMPGSVDFDTGDCNTAVVTIAGQSETIQL